MTKAIDHTPNPDGMSSYDIALMLEHASILELKAIMLEVVEIQIISHFIGDKKEAAAYMALARKISSELKRRKIGTSTVSPN